ncbi:MAG: cytochrome c family protein [Gemmatimonadota bacterium]|nr:cytochrome c family protein [Gemmatimonadota bacterium]
MAEAATRGGHPPWRTRGEQAGRLSRRLLIPVLGIVLVVAVLVPVIARGGPRVPQPVAFNHRKHTQDLGLACDFCHRYVRTGAHSGLPDASTCSLCHSSPQGTSAEAARVTELLAAGDSLHFNKLFRMPDHVFYTHRRHVAIADLACATCHGDIDQTERPPPRALVTIDMAFCVSCHKAEGATLDCNACHR